MKVALVHDYLKEYGGAERVLETLHEVWPQAPIYTTVYLPEFLGHHRKRIAGWDIRVSCLQKLPFVQKLISPIRLLAPWIFENWDFSGFDVVIVSATGAYTPNLINTRPETIHVCYCHTPPRYLYGYPTARDWQKNPFFRIFGELVNHQMRQTDFLSYQRPDYLLCNSQEVKRRIKKFYRREAEVIYPPVEIKKERVKGIGLREKEYYLAGGRLARAKGVELAIEACNQLHVPLKIFGRGFAGYEEELKKLAGPTVDFLGEVNEEELAGLYNRAKALIYPSKQEDFGIIPIEVMSFGVPVIALRQGGVKETVIDGKTGVFFDEYQVKSLIDAIKRLGKLEIREIECKRQAVKFGKERFKKEIKDFVNRILTEKYARTT